ncbi:C-C motif chemokine 17-like [Lampris incognitus]|uniref:C-C motif chemokine 17-like n=1 Tax=Lampris incognitus TaxID=2546036 RepID=UPI0024B54FCD|nr:C-C motif chemokine 17-like [Lampris incognitus]
MVMVVLLLMMMLIMNLASLQTGKTGSCCLQIKNTRVKLELLKSYYRQSQQSCRIAAVVFITEKGKRICTDPNSSLTKSRMVYVDTKEKSPHHVNCNDDNTHTTLHTKRHRSQNHVKPQT